MAVGPAQTRQNQSVEGMLVRGRECGQVADPFTCLRFEMLFVKASEKLRETETAGSY